MSIMSASMAQSDGHPTGDQEVPGLIPTKSNNILFWRVIHGHSLPSADSRRAAVRF